MGVSLRECTVEYGDFLGLDAAHEVSKLSYRRLPRMRNMWRDYRRGAGDALETAPGYRTLCRLPRPIHSITRQRVGRESFLAVHAGEWLYRIPERDRDRPLTLAALPPLLRVGNVPSQAIAVGEEVLLLAEGYFRLAADGTARRVEGTVPTLRFNGEEYEQRNLLSEEGDAVFSLEDLSGFEDGTEGLCYTPTEEGEVSVAGVPALRDRFVITVPPRVLLGGTWRRVTSVAPLGFRNFAVQTILLPEGLREVGASAFRGCAGLSEVILPSTVKKVGGFAFGELPHLERVYLSGDLLLQNGAFADTPALKDVYFSGTEEERETVKTVGGNDLGRAGVTWHCGAAAPLPAAGVLRFPILDAATEVASVTLDGEPLEGEREIFGTTVLCTVATEGELVASVRLTVADRTALFGRRLAVRLKLAAAAVDGVDGDLVGECTRMAYAFGRVIFSGHPRLPGTVFVSKVSDPGYVGILDHVRAGDGANVTGLLSGGDVLYVLTDRGGEVRALAETDSDLLPRVLVRVGAFEGASLTAGVALPDDTVLSAEGGVYGVEATGDRFRLSRRASLIAPLLAREGVPRALAVWDGYLCLLYGERMYLGDTGRLHRDVGAREYEWLLWDGIGSYSNDAPLYRRQPAFGGFAEPPVPYAPAEGEVRAALTEEGREVFYEASPEGAYLVDWDGERTGGTLSPATCLCPSGELLYFGTEEGAVCLFNTDRRGEALYGEVESSLLLSPAGGALAAPDRLARHGERTLERRELFGQDGAPRGVFPVFRDGDRAVLCRLLLTPRDENSLAEFDYTHGGHRYFSGFALKWEDAGMPDRVKRMRPGSFLAEVVPFRNSAFHVLCHTDRGSVEKLDLRTSGGGEESGDFSRFDFEAGDGLTLLLRPPLRPFRRIRLEFGSDGFRSPFGILSVGFCAVGRRSRST